MSVTAVRRYQVRKIASISSKNFVLQHWRLNGICLEMSIQSGAQDLVTSKEVIVDIVEVEIVKASFDLTGKIS